MRRTILEVAVGFCIGLLLRFPRLTTTFAAIIDKGFFVVLPDLFSRRKRLAQKEGDDVYQYETVSAKLRNQILIIIEEWNKCYGSYDDYDPIYKTVVKFMLKELGRQQLSNDYARGESDDFKDWFRKWNSTDDIIDSMELAIRVARYYGNNRGGDDHEIYIQGVAEMNARMLEDGFGFQIEDGSVIQISSTFVHQKMTVPAFGLLTGHEFTTPNEEFRQAYREFNQGNYDDCIHDCCNAFESVLKVILTQKGWAFDTNQDTASKLLSIAFAHNLIPNYMQTELTGLRTILESGVPTVRNKAAGHGAGMTPRNIPKHIAAFQLHQTAAAIVLLVEASRS